ncbi:MAG: hypothetical protein WKF97_21020 [Chitinophagaceae bacterium]
MNNEIDYGQIDFDIRKLVYLVNIFDEIETLFSCSGHQLGEQGYITFKAGSVDALNKLLTALPNQWRCAGFSYNQPYLKQFWINVSIMPAYGLVYNLRFEGSPFFMQRELIEEMEKALSEKLTLTSQANNVFNSH